MIEALRRGLGRLAETTVRFPVAAAFIAAAAVLSAVSISGVGGLTKYILTCAVGAAAGAAAQTAHERFFSSLKRRVVLYAVGLILTALFFLIVRRVSDLSPEIWIRGAVAAFALMTAFVWFPVISSGYRFGENFMASFKAVFQAAFLTGVIFLGCTAIFLAIDRLIAHIPDDAYSYTADVVFVLIAPLVYLSMMPVYPGRGVIGPDAIPDEEMRRRIEKRTGCPKFLELVLCDILVPLVAVFTVVLVVYIILNIGGKFWTDNLLEPLLIAYSAVVIAMTLLVSGLENRLAVLFRRIFPKVLIPIALFQTLASLLLMAETGVTHTRYFVVLYGLFAIISGAILSTVPMRRSGAIAAALIILSAVSVVPPTDAFTVSRFSQTRTLEFVLWENSMLSGGTLTPNGQVSDADRTKIITAVQYLGSMDQLGRVRWLPAGFNAYDDSQFFAVFGFHAYTGAGPQNAYINVLFDPTDVIPISGYDAFAKLNIPNNSKSDGDSTRTFIVGEETFGMTVRSQNGADSLIVANASGSKTIRFEVSDIYKRYALFDTSKSMLTRDEATFSLENDSFELRVIVLNAGFTNSADFANSNVQLLVFVRLK